MRLERRQARITDITSSLSSLVTCNSRIGSDHSGEGLLGVTPAKACWGSPRRRPVGGHPGEGLFGGHPGEGLFGVIPAKACWGSPRRRSVGGHPGEGRGQAP